MKKKLGILAIAALLNTGTYAASIDHIQTYTPEYLGNQSQNGMINKSSVYYNPAGLVHLDNGTYFHIGAQLAVGHEKMDYNGKEYKADLLQYIPTLALYSIRDERTIFWTFGGLGGGGDLEYKDGVAGTAVVPDILNGIVGKLPSIPGLEFIKNSKFKDLGSSAEGKSLYGQTTIGRAWKVNDKLSMSIAGRAVLGMKKLKGDLNVGNDTLGNLHADIDVDRTAWGLGAQIGFNYKATDRLNLAMRYDSRVKLNFKASGDENKVNPETLNSPFDKLFGQLLGGKSLGFSDFYPEYKPGTKTRRDLPAILALGASYKVTDRWTTAISGNYYFNKDAKMDRTKGSSILTGLGVKEVKAEYDNGWEIALGNEYKLNEKWTLLGSVNYAHTGAKVSSYDDIEFALDSVTVGAGLKYAPTDCDEWVFTVCHFFYDQESGHYDKKYPTYKIANPEYDKNITAFGLAYTKKF